MNTIVFAILVAVIVGFIVMFILTAHMIGSMREMYKIIDSMQADTSTMRKSMNKMRDDVGYMAICEYRRYGEADWRDDNDNGKVRK